MSRSRKVRQNQFLCPPPGSYVAVSGQSPVAAVSRPVRTSAAAHRQTRSPGNHGRPAAHPTGLAEKTRSNDRQAVDVNLRGRTVQRLVCLHNMLWYVVNSATCSDWSLSTTRPGSNATASSSPPTCRPAVHRSRPPGRPLVHRDLPPRRQAGPWWRGPAVLETQRPERAACLSLWLHSLIWSWYVDTHPTGECGSPGGGSGPRRPPASSTPSSRCAPSCGHNELQPVNHGCRRQQNHRDPARHARLRRLRNQQTARLHVLSVHPYARLRRS